ARPSAGRVVGEVLGVVVGGFVLGDVGVFDPILDAPQFVEGFGGDAAALNKLRSIKDGIIDTIVTMDDAPDDDTMNLSDLRARGRARGFDEVDAQLEKLDADTVCMLIYTSGTTGLPKGVMLDHGNMMSVAKGVGEHNPQIKTLDEGYILVSYLPLSHIAEQMFTIMGHLEYGGQVYFCPALDLMKDMLPEVRPTVFVGVPRVWEKFQAALEARLGSATGLRKALAGWALSTEKKATLTEIGGGTAGGFGRGLANKLVIGKIHAALGLDRVVFCASGAAPISKRTLEFFASLGVVIHEGFGMTETAGAVTSQPTNRPLFGTVGQAIPGVEVKIGEDGEILLRGRAMTRGYYKNEDETQKLLDGENWLHTGDLGKLDEQGFVSITGRKKEILITAGGKNVAPVEIEVKLNAIAGVGQSVVMGDREPYLVALIVLDREAIPELQSTLGLESDDPAAIAADPKFLKHLQDGVDAANSGLARYQTIKRFEVLFEEFTVEGGELTPSLKLKRPIIAKKYDSQVRALYTNAGATARAS
ncbi:MAG: long-chain fatty acid--CoA ligase, partial [Myxococcota bacterium]